MIPDEDQIVSETGAAFRDTASGLKDVAIALGAGLVVGVVGITFIIWVATR